MLIIFSGILPYPFLCELIDLGVTLLLRLRELDLDLEMCGNRFCGVGGFLADLENAFPDPFRALPLLLFCIVPG